MNTTTHQPRDSFDDNTNQRNSFDDDANHLCLAAAATPTLGDLFREERLGDGAFGEVWRVRVAGEEERRFALKSQPTTDAIRGKDAADSIRREIDALRRLGDHPQIADLVCTYEEEEEDDDHTTIHLLMGLVPGGEMWDRVHQQDAHGNVASGLSDEEARFHTFVIADTLGYIHDRGFVYRDLKPENILIDRKGYPVLVDFGCAKRLCPEDTTTHTFCGTPNYLAPEMLFREGHHQGVDLWALGVTLYEMITGENPFYYEGMEQTALYEAICYEAYYPLGEGRSAVLADLLDGLLRKNPEERLGVRGRGVEDVLRHEWYTGFDLEQVRSQQWRSPWGPEEEEAVPGDTEDLPERNDPRSSVCSTSTHNHSANHPPEDSEWARVEPTIHDSEQTFCFDDSRRSSYDGGSCTRYLQQFLAPRLNTN